MNDNNPANTEYLDAQTRLDIRPSNVLVGALSSDLSRCVIIGRDRQGRLYAAASNADMTKTLWDIEQFKKDHLRE